MLRKCIGIIVTVALVVSVMVFPTGAADVSGELSVTAAFGGSPVISFPRAGDKNLIYTAPVDVSGSTSSTTWFSIDNIVFDVSTFDVPAGGSVGVYFSWAGGCSHYISSFVKSLDYYCLYSIANTSSYDIPVSRTEFSFSPTDPSVFPLPGVQLSVRIDDVDTLTSLTLDNYGSGIKGVFDPVIDEDFYKYYYVPSISLVASESSAGLDALESVADQIAEGNNIARAMYADIMVALNALKNDTALMASYINDCLIYLNSIETATVGIYNLCAAYLHNLASIAQTAEDIEAELDAFHTDFMTKLDLLISTIASESDDIQATMDRIYDQLIAWLETNFKEAISPEFEGSNSDLSQGIANNDAIEQEWTGSLSDTWSAMHIADFTFDSSFTSGFMWVSGWFSNIYNSLGLYGSIVILPLIIGICKLLLGYFRFSGHGHSKGGGDVDA